MAAGGRGALRTRGPSGSASAGGKMAALLWRLGRAPCGLRAARTALPAAAAAVWPPRFAAAAPPDPRRPLSFSAAELVRAAPGRLQPYLRLMRLHQPAGEGRGGKGRGGNHGDAAANGGGSAVAMATRLP